MKHIQARGSLALTFLLLAISAACVAAAPANPPNKPGANPGQSGFVTVKGRQFQLDGKPYYYAGANLWYGMYLGSPGKTGNRARLTSELDQLAAQGIDNLRVLAISESSTLKRAVTPAVHAAAAAHSTKRCGRGSTSCSPRWRSAT